MSSNIPAATKGRVVFFADYDAADAARLQGRSNPYYESKEKN
jgi:hypothetical protein